MALTQEQKSAKAAIEGALGQFGLKSLGTWAWGLFMQGVPVEQIMLDVRDRKEYKDRFAGMAALQKKGRAISEAEYIQYEQRAAQLMRAYGLPQGFYDQPADFAKYIGGEVSVTELEERLQAAQAAGMDDPRGQVLRDKLSRLYGVANAIGAVTAWMIDPQRTHTLVRQQFAAAQAATEAAMTGFGDLTKAEAERVAGTGATQDQTRSTFSDLARMNELTTTLPGEAQTQLGREDLLEAGFEGDAQATEKVRRQGQRRASRFKGGGDFAATQTGLTGLGSSSS